MMRIYNLNVLLNSDDLNESLFLIDEFISKLCKDGDELQNLTEPQKIYFFNQTLEREVNNGGFDQYFSNASNNYAGGISLTAMSGAIRTGLSLKYQKLFYSINGKEIPCGKNNFKK